MEQDGFINCIDECVDDLPQDDPSFGLNTISDIKIRGAGCEPTPIGVLMVIKEHLRRH